jgi:hypothetical protein
MRRLIPGGPARNAPCSGMEDASGNQCDAASAGSGLNLFARRGLDDVARPYGNGPSQKSPAAMVRIVSGAPIMK